MKLVEETFSLLYPGKEFNYSARITYNNRFKDYGANVKLRGNCLEFSLSKKWRPVSREIRMGLLQELMLKLWGRKGRTEFNTSYIDLYNSFVRNLHLAIPKYRDDPLLSASFDRVNEKYFYHIVEKPNLEWGINSRTSLGSYDYKTDTIRISGLFRGLTDKDPELLDFIMHHEVLHKAHKFRHKAGFRSRFHDREFRRREREFENYDEVDKRLKKALGKARIKSLISTKPKTANL